MIRLKRYLEEVAPEVEAALEQMLPRAELPPATLHEAMRYSVLGGGKRLRPALCLIAAEAFGGTREAAMPAACALEMVHAYSLVHDDLPAMDDGQMRRGKLACHRAFGEAMAILAGDGLLTLAFETLATRLSPAAAPAAVATLARAAGHRGMVGGQVMDLEGEGAAPELERVEEIDRRKTGALLAASARLGGIVAGAPGETLDALERYGNRLGVAFQIVDDLLDLGADAEATGKGVGNDTEAEKLTYPAAIGPEKAAALAREAANEAQAVFKDRGKEALYLRLLADYVVERSA